MILEVSLNCVDISMSNRKRPISSSLWRAIHISSIFHGPVPSRTPSIKSYLCHKRNHSSKATIRSLLTSTSKPPSTSNALLQFLDLNHFRCIDPLQYQLCHTVSLLDLEILLAVVEQQNLDLATIIRVNDSSTSINHMLGSQTRARCNMAICTPQIGSVKFQLTQARGEEGQRTSSFRHSHADVCIYQDLSP